MSYLDYYRTNIAGNNSSNEKIVGTCDSMCPEEEIAMREKEKLVHLLEVIGPNKKLIKSYSRSAADCTLAVPRLLRPFPVLRDTVQYLLLNVTKRKNVPTPMIYDFINDRLRAVRQDMTIQRLPPEECTALLEPMVRFYVYYGYTLYSRPLKDFDPVLNKKYMLECLTWFLSCCDMINMRKTDITDGVFLGVLGLSMDPQEGILICDRVLMESLYLICNLDNTDPLYRYLSLPKDIKKNPDLQIAYKIAIANLTGNYVRVNRLVKELRIVTYFAFSLYLPELHRRALRVMSVAYNSKQLTVPIAALRKWLHLNSDSEAKGLCERYGLTCDGDAVNFNKSLFKHNVL